MSLLTSIPCRYMDNDFRQMKGGADRDPFTVCAITYIARPQNLPPFFNAALSLTQLGIRVDAYGTIGRIGVLPREEIAPGFTFTRIGLRSREFFLRIPGRLGTNIITAGLQYVFSYIEYNTRMYYSARSCRAGLVEAHDLPSLLCARLIARRRRCPIVYFAHELWPEMGQHALFSRFWRWLEKKLVRGVDLIVTPEGNRARIYLDEYGAPELPLVVANCPPFRPPAAGTSLRDLAAAKGMPSSCVVLYQGLVTRERCIDEIVAASGHFAADVTLAIVGNGIDDWMDPEARLPAGRPILYHRHVSYEQLFDYTASADIGLLFYRNTCRNNYFCAPNKLYEYMMMGLPVITCNYPGLVGFVEENEIGLCVDPEDPLAIAAAINRVAGDRALRDRMRANCLRLAKERWNWEREFARLYEAYRRLSTHLPATVPERGAVNATVH